VRRLSAQTTPFFEENNVTIAGPLPGPSRVQIQTQSGCNGRCVFCPNEDTRNSGIAQGQMPPALFQKIIDDLAETPPRRISPYLMNEPLADARLPEFVRYVSDRIPGATTLITSNGVYLTETMMAALLDAGLKRLKISLQALDPETNRRIMGYSSEKVIQNVLAAKRILKEKKARAFDLRVSTIVTSINEDDIRRARKFWSRHGVRLVTSALENRGGNIKDADAMNVGVMKPKYHCIRPSREMDILFNGDAVLCCVDWHRTVIAGNVGECRVRDVWNGPVYARIREGLRDADETKLPPLCLHCTESACPDTHRHFFSNLLAKLGLLKSPKDTDPALRA